MFEANEESYLKVYISGNPVHIAPYCIEETIFIWENPKENSDIMEDVYVMGPRTKAKYNEFVKKLEKECPLLVELV